MLRERARLLSRGMAALDAAMIGLAYLMLLAMRHGHRLLAPSQQILGWFAMAGFLLCVHLQGGYRSLRRGSLLAEAGLIVRATLASALLLPATGWMAGIRPPGRELGLLLLAITGSVSGARLGLRSLLRKLRSRGYNLRYYLIAGAGARARTIDQEITRQSFWGIRVIGFLRGEGGEVDPSLRPQLLGELGQLSDMLQLRVVDGVYLLAEELQPGEMRQALECCRRFGIQAFVDLHPFEDLCGHLTVSEFAQSPLLAIAHTNLGEHHAWLKRAFDCLLAAAGMMVLAPLLLLIAALIKLLSPGPVLFRQPRVGRNGRLFTMLKFRSMVLHAEKRQAEIAAGNEMSGPVFKMRHDPRISPLGRYLRMWSLDELPQLWNVLRGDMSLVGPRPPLPGEVGQYQSWHRRRLSVRPGLTCLWQVSGRNRIDFDDWMKLDLEYIDHWSWWLDLKILFRTLPAMLRGQ